MRCVPVVTVKLKLFSVVRATFTTVMTAEVEIIVIGAGASGLKATSVLMEAGCKVLVLEGRDRVGGRCHTVDGFDVGASWIHGGQAGNPVYHIAQQQQLELHPTDYDDKVIFDSSGVRLQREYVSKCNDEFALFEKKLSRLQDKEGRDISLQQGIMKATRLLIDRGDMDELRSNPNLLDLFLRETYDLEYGCYLGDTSLYYFDCDDELEGEDYLLRAGLGTLIEAFAQQMRHVILLNRTVVRIERGGEAIKVHTSDGVEFTCHEVIVTVPLGVLKAALIEFVEPLPSIFQDALNMSGMGLLNKSILIFDDVFWDPHASFIIAVGDRNAFPTDCGYWFLNLHKFFQVKALVLFTGSEHSERLELLSDSELTSSIMVTLNRLYPLTSRPPTRALHTRWMSDPLSRGSYSYRRVGFRHDVGFKAFHRSFYGGRLHFAGEHTSARSFATVHGALESGERVAKTILEKRKRSRRSNCI